MFKTINKPQSITLYDIAISQRINKKRKTRIEKVSILEGIELNRKLNDELHKSLINKKDAE